MPFAHYLVDIAACLRRLTRLPLPADPAEEDRPFAESCWAYPVIGAAVGGAAAVAWLAAQGLGLAPGVAAVLALSVSLAVTGAAPERALARAAAALLPRRGDDEAIEWSAIVIALVVVLKAAAIVQAAATGPVGGVLIGAAAIAYACQLAALHAAPGDGAEPPPIAPAAAGVAIAVAVSLPVMIDGWLAGAIVAAAATGGIVIAARRPGADRARRALPAVLALAEILALLAVVASR